MNLIVSFPSIVKKYADYYKSFFSAEGFTHFKKALLGMMISDNKTLEAINRLYVIEPRNQTSFNRFFNRQNFDLEQLNQGRLEMLQQNEQTRLKTDPKQGGVLIIDNTLLKHYGKCFDNIYNQYDYVHKCYRWCHDLVTLHYNDNHTDYPVFYQLWDPPDWEAVAQFLIKKGFTINQDKWDKREQESQKWLNYIRARYRAGRKKYPDLVQIYKTKIHVAEDLLRKFSQQYPQLNYPVLLDYGFTSAEFCKIITQEFKKDYVGGLRADRRIIQAGGEEKPLGDFVEQLREQHFDPTKKAVFPKVGFTYKGKKQYYYAYHANHRIKGFEKKQRLVIAYDNEELSGSPYYMITNRLNWYPSHILGLRRQRWPVETYHQEGKAEGLDKYQVRNLKAIQSYIALVVITYSILKCAIHDRDLLSSLQQRLQTKSDGTLPFLRRLMQAECMVLLVEYIFAKVEHGESIQQILKPLNQLIAYS